LAEVITCLYGEFVYRDALAFDLASVVFLVVLRAWTQSSDDQRSSAAWLRPDIRPIR